VFHTSFSTKHKALIINTKAFQSAPHVPGVSVERYIASC